MKFTRLIAIVFLVSTSAKADLMVSTTEINLGDTSKYCYAKTQNIIVYWTDPTSSEPPLPLNYFTASMTGNYDEFHIEPKGCDNETDGSISIPSGGSCRVEITMLPLHNGVKKKKLNIDGSYSNNGIQNDVSLTIPVNGTSYPPNSPFSNPMGCSEPFVIDECPDVNDPCSPS